jgi:YD repeat-containing protein
MDADPHVKTFDFDTTTSTGNLTAITDAKGNRTGYEYDGFNRLFRTCYPSAANGASTNASDCETTTYRTTTVTGASQATALVEQVTLRDNTSTISFGYDVLGRVSSKSGAVSETFTYDNFNQLTYRTNSTNGHTISGNPSTGTYTYNAHGWLLSEAQPMGTVSYQYDDYGRRIRLTYPTAGNPFITYDYNNGDEVVSIKENGSTQLAGFSFNNYGQRTGIVRQNGQNTGYAYDASLRLQYLTQGTSGASHYNQITYGYSAADQIATKSGNNGAYGFTPTNQSIGYTINGLNQVSQIGSTPLNHDLRGNITGDTGGTFTYNANNLMVTATQSGITTTLGYDSAGRLSSVNKNNATTRFLYDGVDLIAEFDGNGTLQRRYVHGPSDDEPLVQYNADGCRSACKKDPLIGVIGV